MKECTEMAKENENGEALLVPCPICGSEKWSLYTMAPSHYGPENHQVTECAQCSMVFTNPQTQTYLKEVEERGVLERHFDDAAMRGKCLNASFLLRLLRQFSEGGDLLDFGCGVGAVVGMANKSGWNAIGYDLNFGLVEGAKRHWKCDTLYSGPLDEFYAQHENSFDAIVSFQVFEHIQKPVEAGKALFKLLRPGGIILIDVPNVNQPGEWFSKGKTLDPTSHWCHFSKKTLSDLMRKIGCEVVYKSASPSLVKVYKRLGFKDASVGLGVITKALFPPVGTGVCVIGRKPR